MGAIMTSKRTLVSQIILSAVLALAQPAMAKSERIGSFVVPDDAPNLIVLAGDITQSSPLDFKTALLRQPQADVIMLNSDGGNVVAGLLVADEIHLRGLSTYIPADASDGVCLRAALRHHDDLLDPRQLTVGHGRKLCHQVRQWPAIADA